MEGSFVTGFLSGFFDGSFVSGFLFGIFIGQAALTIALMLVTNINRNDEGGE